MNSLCFSVFFSILILSEVRDRVKSVKKLKSQKSVTGKGQKNVFRHLSRTTSAHRSRDPFRSALLDGGHGPKPTKKVVFQTTAAIEMAATLHEDEQVSGPDVATDITLQPIAGSAHDTKPSGSAAANITAATPSTKSIALAAAEAGALPSDLPSGLGQTTNGHKPEPSGSNESRHSRQHSVSQSASIMNRFTQINRQGSTMLMEEGQTSADHDPIMEEEPEEFTWRRRIWYIARVFVVVYLYMSTSFGFCFMFNQKRWDNNEQIIFILLNLMADIFMYVL